MKQSKIFHTLYLAVMALPLFLMGVFAIYSQNHEINDNTLQVQENIVVDFNQLIPNEDKNIHLDSYYLFVTYNKTILANNEYFFKYDYTGGTQSGTWGRIALYNPTDGIINNYGNNEIFTLPNNTDLTSLLFYAGNGNTSADFKNVQLFNLTQMYGIGNEPSITYFNEYFNEPYYDFTLSTPTSINGAIITYNDTDIMSQFMYVSYNALDKYLNFSQYQPFTSIYNWAQNTFFGGNAPMIFFIMFQMMCYWLVMSLFWLIFDVLLYVPSMIHKMIDKARLE